MNRNTIISLIGKIRQKANKFIDKELKKSGMKGLVASHGAILSYLFLHNGKLTMKEITDLTKKDKSTVTALVNKLVKYGYVEKKKSDEDSRITYVILTEKTKSIEIDLKSISEKLISTTYKDFSKEDERILLILLEKIYNNF